MHKKITNEDHGIMWVIGKSGLSHFKALYVIYKYGHNRRFSVCELERTLELAGIVCKLDESKQIDEVYSNVPFKENTQEEVKNSVSSLMANYDVVKQIQPSLKLCVHEADKEYYSLLEGDNVVQGWLSIIDDGTYIHIGMLYVLPEYRKTGSSRWLLYSVKEHIGKPYIVDGVTSKNGQAMIDSVFNNKVFNVMVLNKKDNTMNKYDGKPLYGPDLCYVIEAMEIPYKQKNHLSEGLYTYYDIFDE